jgi:hypothetical protein
VRCQGLSLHSSGCVVSVPLECRSLGASSKRAREDLSDQGLPIIDFARNASEALPCRGSALSSTKINNADRVSFIGAMLVLGEVLKITIVERIFYIGREKLMTIKAFAWIFNFVSGWLTWIKTFPPWQAVKQNVDDFIHWAHKLNHDGRARDFL